MSLVSIQYLAFLLIVVLINYYSPIKYRNWVLLIASLFFIGFYNLFSLAFLLLISSLSFFAGKFLSNNKSKPVYYLSCAVNLFSLFFLKYFHFEKGLNWDAANFQIEAIAIALGISFYALQNISYLIEVYKDRIKTTDHFIDFVLFNSFFAKVISGPIESPKTFLPGLRSIEGPDWHDFNYGLQRMGIGFLKKMVLSDRIAPIVAKTFDQNLPMEGFTVWVGVCLFSVQLYFNFSGYTDIAIGSARLLGIKLSENFNFPFRATSISDFWRRWHISLMDWLKLYLYFPVVYNYRKHKKYSVFGGLILVFLLSGFWHGLGLTFFVWSVCHMVYVIAENLLKKSKLFSLKRIPKAVKVPFQIFLTFNLFCFSELFFRSKNISQSLDLLDKLFVFPFFPSNWLNDFWALLIGGGTQEDLFNIYITFSLVVCFLLFEKKIFFAAVSERFNYLLWLLILAIIFIFGIFHSGEQFIYLQF